MKSALSKMLILWMVTQASSSSTPLAEQVAGEPFKQLYNSLYSTNKRTVDSSMEKHAGAWLKAIPTEPSSPFPVIRWS